MFGGPELIVDYLLRLVVLGLAFGLLIPLSGRLGQRMFGVGYTHNENNLHAMVSLGALAGLGIGRDGPASLAFLALVIGIRLLHLARRGRQARNAP